MIKPISNFGRPAARWISITGGLARFLVQALLSWTRVPREGRRVVSRVMLNQIWFTAIQAIPIVIVLSGILSFLVISQAVRELGRLGATQYIGSLMVIAIVRELGPLITALTVVGRSGTAIASELATNKVMGEVDALEGMGIDPVQYLVLPRLGGAVVSVFGLLIVFDMMAVLSGFVAATSSGMAGSRYFNIVLESLTLRDVQLTIVKGIFFGLIVGIVPSFYGMRVRPAPTEVPIATSQAIVTSILAVFVGSAAFVAFSI